MINIDALNDDEKLAALESIHKSIAESKEIQRKKITTNVEMIVKALKKIEADLKQRYDETGNLIANLKSGEDGKDGRDGKDGKDGRPGKDGAIGPRGYDGLPGRNGLDGKDGVSITDAHIDFDGSLIISLSTGRVINVGEVVTADIAEKIKVITNGGGTSQYVLDTLASLQAQISGITSGLDYQGTWNASTNTPTLTSSVGTNGYYYIVATAGSTNLNGVTDWQVGDWAVFNGSVWQKIDQTNLVTSVAGRTGAIVLTTSDIGGLGTIATQAANNVSITGGSITGITDLAIADGGTGASTAPNARTNLGATTVGANVFTLTNPSAITFPRFNADNTVSALDASTFRTAIGAGTSSTTGTVTSVGGTGTVNGLTLSGTVTTSGNLTFGGTLSGIDNSALTNSSITIGGTSISLGSSSNTLANDITIYGVTVGRGASAVATNTALGASSLAANTTGARNTVVGASAGAALTTGGDNTAIGYLALSANIAGTNNTAIGRTALQNGTTGTRNTGVGQSALRATTADSNTAVGYNSLIANTTGNNNVGVGDGVLQANTTGSLNTAVGTSALQANTTTSSNTAVGYQSAYSNTTGTITAVGYRAGYSNTTGDRNAYFGGPDGSFTYGAGYSNTTGSFNSGFGSGALASATTASGNSAVGYQALFLNTTGASNVAVGQSALRSNTTAGNNTAVGFQAGTSNVTGTNNAYFGHNAGQNATANQIDAFGIQAVKSSTSDFNAGFGFLALTTNTTGSYNTALGQYALTSNTTASNNTAVGYQAGYSNTAGGNTTLFGYQAGYALTINGGNTFIGYQSGNAVTTGYYHTILGSYSGNQGGLDIRTANNYIVLSDGQGNPRQVQDGSGNIFWKGSGAGVFTLAGISAGTSDAKGIDNSDGARLLSSRASTSSREHIIFYNTNGDVGSIDTSGSATSYNTSSDYRLKNTIAPMTGALAKVAQLKPCTYKWNADGSDGEGFIAHELAEVCPQAVTGDKDAVDSNGNPKYQGIDVSFLVATLTAAIQELKAEFDAYKASHP